MFCRVVSKRLREGGRVGMGRVKGRDKGIVSEKGFSV